jgi:aryl-alcohol dehydrogenase-like predicted oxidoreductase
VNLRQLGTGGPTVGSIGLGCMGLSAVYDPGSVSEADGIAVIRRAIDLGVTLLDTSDAYGPYRNEQLVGRAVVGRRDEVVIATKAGCAPHAESFVPRPDGRPEVLRRCCDESLARLGVDVIDLWQLHRRDPAVPIEDSVGAMGEMVAAGKVRAIGVSEVTLDELEAAHATHPIATLQSELSLWTRDLRAELLPWCEAAGIGVIAFSPLGRGFLTGRFGADASFGDGDARAVNPRFTPAALAANQAIVARVRAVADRRGVTPAQVALAWVLAQGPAVVPIQGAQTVAQVEENVAGATLTLEADDLAALEALPPAIGDRY